MVENIGDVDSGMIIDESEPDKPATAEPIKPVTIEAAAAKKPGFMARLRNWLKI
jgi:hypothetical protein